MVGTEVPGEAEFPLRHVDRDDLAAGQPGVLQGEVTESADAEHGDPFTGTTCATLTALNVVTPAHVRGAASNDVSRRRGTGTT